jgi:hypothetical protein
LDLLGIAETWLDESVKDSEISIGNYTLYRKDRNRVKMGKGGGVVLYAGLLGLRCMQQLE